MSAVACQRISQRPATLSDLYRRTQIARTCFSRCSSAQQMTEAAVWRRSTIPHFSSSRAHKGRILNLLEPARFYYAGRPVRQFGKANQRPASVSDLGRVPQISAPCFSRSNIQHLRQFVGTSSRSLLEPARWWRRQVSGNGRIYALHEPARFFLSGLGQARQFGTANQREQQTTKPHLYLVLDDHDSGFSIHKLDVDTGLEVSSSAETPLCFPEPPVIRLAPPTIGRAAQFAAIGSYIIATCPSTKLKPLIEECESITLTFDTKTAMFNTSRVFPEGLRCGYEAAINVKNKLYLFESFTDDNDGLDGPYFRGGLHCLAADPCDNENDWSWKSLSHRSPFFWSWTDNPTELPFDPAEITADVVHPRTGTILLSAPGHRSWSTFSYGTGGSGKWKRRGGWVLPFKGHAHYDGQLDAWVGLHSHSVGSNDADGYLCACSVMSSWQQPNWKVGRDMLFLKDSHWRHVDAKLVYMGKHSKYCLVERLLPEGADMMKYVLRLTTFIVKYDEDGDLRITVHQPARFYKAPSYRSLFDVQAFWM